MGAREQNSSSTPQLDGEEGLWYSWLVQPPVRVNRRSMAASPVIARETFHVHDSTRETLLCKRNIAPMRMVGRSSSSRAAAAAPAAGTISTNNINKTNSFLKRKLDRRF
jgi:hypothetical protein